ncbi:hypothetical protein GF312_19290, partial [Candidatus Poribacteria bacterium]|nr:hypothetical protein [Candidatus Poribacteria bacterium]
MKLRFSLSSVFALFVAVILVSASYGDIDPDTCVGVWLFDAGEGDTAIDSSGNDLDGTIFNGPEWVDGKFSKALKFDGADDYINLPTTVSDGWEGLTVLAWITIEL